MTTATRQNSLTSEIPSSAPAYAQVVFNLPLKDEFTYGIPEALQGQVLVGMRVLAPFGPRKITGYVVGLSDTCEGEFEIKFIEDLPDGAPVISEELLSLTRWVADYYNAGWGEVIKAALPGGIDEDHHEIFYLTDKGEAALQEHSLPQNALKILLVLKNKTSLNKKQIQKILRKQFSAYALGQLVRDDYVSSQVKIKQKSVAYTTDKKVCLTLDNYNPEEIEKLLKRSPKQREVFDALTGSELLVSELAKLIPGYTAPLRELKRKGLAKTVAVKQERTSADETDPEWSAELPQVFTEEQQSVFQQVAQSITASEFKTFLLHGVTGSGKTEVYMRAIQLALDAGKTSIMLVPEISLTPQTVNRFQRRFGSNVAILHSGLTNIERYLEWKKIREEKVSIVVGARSAVFAPFKNLGVLIIDEEHDTSYKQDSVPRYHARETAVARAKACGAVVILGSATPSLESRRKAAAGEYEYLMLEERIGDRLLPVIRIVDMRKERDEAKNYSIFSIPLKQAMMDRLEQKEQIFLFLNRRGTANYVVCRKCGFVFECLRCSVSLTFHGNSKTLRCHYCDFSVTMPGKCIECSGEIIRFSGFGTQKLEEETQALFPKARIKRMDRDTMKTRASFENIYNEMRNGDIDILIGTQMITKGHHFPNVTLVGVVYADLSLHVPDFRSSERTFQLLTQVAGRAGRGRVPGIVIVQAHNPEHYVFDYVPRHDYNGFFEKELILRQKLNYPPFTQLVALEIESDTEPEGEAAVNHLKQFLSEPIQQSPGVELLGPSRAAMYRINNRFRWHLILRSQKTEALQSLVTQCLANQQLRKLATGKIKITVDVDPMNML
ncbi:MAG: primosomal protein N' [Nitrospinota bacterium]|nr:primosomal protein N' [Nitrospinota bacterium]